MAIVLGTSPVWRFFLNGAPAANAVMRFWKNSDRDTTQPAYLDAGGTNAVTELSLNANGEPASQLYFNDALVYYITVTNQSNSIVYYEIQGYVPGVTNVTTNFYLQQNYAPNPQFYFHKNDAVSLSTGVPAAIAPPTWFADMDYTVAPTTFDAVTFSSPAAGSTDIGARTDVTPTSFLKYTKTDNVAGQTYKRIYFKIPTVRAFAGETITLKMDIKASVAMTANLFYQQDLGTGGTGSGIQAQTTLDTINLTTGWITHSASATITALDGLNIGTDENDYIIFGVDLVGLIGVASGTVDIVNVQMFQGSNDIDYAYSDPFYDTALSLPVPLRPVGGGVSTDSGKQITVNSDGYYSLQSQGQAENNLIWGGDFTNNPWQEGAASVASGTSADISTYVTDGYKLLTTDARANPNKFAISHQRQANAPTFAQADYNTSDSLYVELTGNAQGTLAIGDLIRLQHVIEGYDWAAAKERPVSMGFWCRSNVIGTYCVALTNSGNDLTYIHEYEITQADTWTFIEFQVPAYSGGTWDYTTGTGLQISWTLASGTTGITPTANKDQWLNLPGKIATDAITSTWASTANANFYISLPRMFEGTSLANYQRASKAGVLRKAQRYLERSINIGLPAPVSGVPSTYAMNTAGGREYYKSLFMGRTIADAAANYAGAVPVTSDWQGAQPFKEEKRITPSLYYWTLTESGTNVQLERGYVAEITGGVQTNSGAAPNVTGLNRRAVTATYWQSTVNKGIPAYTGGTNNTSVIYHWIADARY